MQKLLFLIIATCLGFTAASAQEFEQDRKAIIAVLDDFHDAASKADKDRYLGHFTEDGVFLGTDEWERWPLKPDFTDYVDMRFANGGWSYHSEKKNINFSKDGTVAWFDETSISNRNDGRFRGSGVLEKVDGKWKIAHYVLSYLVYNEIGGEVGKVIAEERKKHPEHN
ncbi:nuclear transport factor 2 family protein [Pseudemcibacter aquimaris]|uniref:nuclear transport factor 2 family protein n=1 Tax=Pseudemcibacter aquimaris TaxID=2857064 RepID=UPI0020112CE5|nr:nuclear transport factor 2 family protein [Pseudemcibacter aquimaris]MCC3862084.1 nuclear transport factor 2 family protein [Pseudemcibacter aquimaris]WDU58837.1 nuclear transport factor 2 family protein [Pseudemcibacter aquimaris]